MTGADQGVAEGADGAGDADAAGSADGESRARCPRCSTPLETDATGAVVDRLVTCQRCGHQMSSTFLAEYVSLGQWQVWAGERAVWLAARLLAGDFPPPEEPSGYRPKGAVGSATEVAMPLSPRAARTRSGAGSVLFVAGGGFLVLAGIAFVAFAWDLLGPLGQVATLFAIGAAGLGAATPLARQLPGTATTVGVVGALMVSTAALATRLLGEDVIGGGASVIVSVAALLALTAAGVKLRSRLPGVGEVAAALGASLAAIMLACAPLNDGISLGDNWYWWVALSFAISSLAILLFAERCSIRAWPPLAAVGFVGASIALAAFVTESVDSTKTGVEPLLHSAVYLGCAVIALLKLAVLRRFRGELLGLAATLGGLSYFTALAAGETPNVRPFAALSLVALSIVVLAVPFVVARDQAPREPSTADEAPNRWLTRITTLSGAIAIGTAVGFFVAPWTNFTVDGSDAVGIASWLYGAWPAWRGVLAGVAFASLVTVAALVFDTDRADRVSARSLPRGVVPVVALTAALLTWVGTVAEDPSPAQYALPPNAWSGVVDVLQQRVGVALIVTGAALFILAMVRLLPPWSAWLGAVGLDTGALLMLEPVDLRSGAAPEIYAVMLMVPMALAGACWWWLHRPESPSTWITLAPAVTVALLPPVLSLLDETAQRWWQGLDPSGEYQVRTVSVLAVGVALTVVGARQHWAGFLFPGLAALLAVAAINLIELGRFLPQWVSFGLAGALLVVAGARWESVQRLGRWGTAWASGLH